MALAALLIGDLDLARARLSDAAAEAAVSSNAPERVGEWEARATLALRRGEIDGARQAWQRTLDLSKVLGIASIDRRARCELARLELSGGEIQAARAMVDGVLAEVDGDARPRRRTLAPAALLACHDVLKAAGDPRADVLRDDLLARLDEQLAALPDDAAREQLLRCVPYWHAVQAMR